MFPTFWYCAVATIYNRLSLTLGFLQTRSSILSIQFWKIPLVRAQAGRALPDLQSSTKSLCQLSDCAWQLFGLSSKKWAQIGAQTHRAMMIHNTFIFSWMSHLRQLFKEWFVACLLHAFRNKLAVAYNYFKTLLWCNELSQYIKNPYLIRSILIYPDLFCHPRFRSLNFSLIACYVE